VQLDNQLDVVSNVCRLRMFNEILSCIFFSLTERNTDNFFPSGDCSALCVYGTRSRVPDWGNFIVTLGQVWFGTNFCEELV